MLFRKKKVCRLCGSDSSGFSEGEIRLFPRRTELIKLKVPSGWVCSQRHECFEDAKRRNRVPMTAGEFCSHLGNRRHFSQMRDVEIKVFSSLHPEVAYLPIRFRTQVEVSRSFVWGDKKVDYRELHWVNGQIDFDDRGDLPDVISNKKSLLELTSCFSAEMQISESDELNLYLKAGTRFAAPISKRVQDSYASGSAALVLSFRVECPTECDMPVSYWEIDSIFRDSADKIPDNYQSAVS